MQNEQAVFRNIHVIYAYMYIIKTNEKEGMNLKESKEGCVRGFGGK